MEDKLLLQALKQVLKSKGKTYADLAHELGLSEVSVKRLFAEERCTLERLNEICRALGISIFDLLRFIDSRHEATFQFTVEQEEFFAADLIAFDFWNELYKNHVTPTRAAEVLDLPKARMRAFLRRFEEFGLIELHAGDRVRFRVAGSLGLRDGGVMQKLLTRSEIDAFVSRLDPLAPDEQQSFTMSDRRVSRKTLKEMNTQLRRLFQDFRDRAFREEHLLPKEELVRVQWLGGISPRPMDERLKANSPARR